MPTPVSPDDLRLLAQYDTPTICNVIELLDARPRTAGYMDGRIQACFPKMPPMVSHFVGRRPASGQKVVARWRLRKSTASPSAGRSGRSAGAACQGETWR